MQTKFVKFTFDRVLPVDRVVEGRNQKYSKTC